MKVARATLALSAIVVCAAVGCRRTPVAVEADARDAATEASAARAQVAALIAGAVAAEKAGQGEKGSALRASAATVAAAAGLVDEAARQHLALVFAHLYRTRDIVEARRHLDAAQAAGASVKVAAQALYYQGLVARAAGDTGAALAALEQATQRAQALGLSRDAWAAAQQRADLLAELGLIAQALAAYQALASVRPQLGDCDRAAFDGTLAWTHLLGVEAHHPAASLAVAQQLLASALELSRRRCAQDAAALAVVLCNQAWAALLAGQLDQAEQALRAMADGDRPPTVYVELWRLDVAARLSVARGRLRPALERFRQLENLARTVLASEALWRALVGQAQVWERLKRPAQVSAAYTQAEEVLDQMLLHLPLSQGRGGLALIRNRSASGLVAQELARGRPAQAVAVARRARARVLRALDRQTRLAALPPEQRRRWDAAVARFLDLRAELEDVAAGQWTHAGSPSGGAPSGPPPRQAQLAQQARQALEDATAVLASGDQHPALPDGPPPVDQLTLGYFPLPSGWMGFATGARGLTVRRLALPPEAIAQATGIQLLEPFAAALAGARTVRVLSYGALSAVDFHALTWRARPLIATHAVVYGLDLGARAAAADSAPTRALLIADPAGNLPGARAEAAQVLRRWSSLWAPPALIVLQGLNATRARALAALPGAGFFHYAGHGRHAGDAGLDSELPLADGGSLSVGDVLALPHAPAQVVLLGCETGRAAAGADVGLGLAQAFVLAGARQVLAASRPVADALGTALAGSLYSPENLPLSEQLQRAQQALATQRPAPDWAAFRIFVP